MRVKRYGKNRSLTRGSGAVYDIYRKTADYGSEAIASNNAVFKRVFALCLSFALLLLPSSAKARGDLYITMSQDEINAVRIVNEMRARGGLGALAIDPRLTAAARAKAADLSASGRFSHDSPTLGDPFSLMRSFGVRYGYAGENLARGCGGAYSVCAAWAASPEHLANIMFPKYSAAGAAYVDGVWCMMFAG